MIIDIENTSSPGASFTDNTNEVLLKTYDWINENNGRVLSFKQFRMELQQAKGINDNNNRNIYPLLKNMGLANYEKGEELAVESFYTNLGLAYIKALQAINRLEETEYNSMQKALAKEHFKTILEEILTCALKNLIKQQDVNYIEPFKLLLRFLLTFDKINKSEFAYLIYVNRYINLEQEMEKIIPTISSYRNGETEFDVHVNVRNDINIREKTNKHKREEGLSFLTSYGYFIGLLQQAGLIKKDGKYYVINEKKRYVLEELGGASYE